MAPEGFSLLYEEGPCLAVGKPAGLLTQAPPHIDSLERRLREFLKVREGKTGKIYLGVLHRLDRPVSGVLLFARHVRAARRQSSQFEQRMIDKQYVAVLEGNLPEDEDEWIDHVGKVPDQAQAVALPSDHPDARVARLRYRVLARSLGHTCVELKLETGRFHQIRLQSSLRGFPILGDTQYGSHVSFGVPVADDRERCIALHARRISFYHPMTHEHHTVEAPVPDYWGGWCDHL